MGLFSSIREAFTGKRSATIALTASMKREWADSDNELQPVQEPDPLRDLKAYTEEGIQFAGFDFTAVHRYRSQTGTWWLEGENYKTACAILRSLKKFQEQAQRKLPEIPDAIDFAISHSTSYSKGADANKVPVMQHRQTKSHGETLNLTFRSVPRETYCDGYVSVEVNKSGQVVSARLTRVTYRPDFEKWSITLTTTKRDGLHIKSVKKNDEEQYDEKERARDVERRMRLEERLSSLSTIESITQFALSTCDIADDSGIDTTPVRDALNSSSPLSFDVRRDRDDMILLGKPNEGDGGMLKFETNGEQSRMRYWERRGAPTVECNIFGGKCLPKRNNNERTNWTRVV